MQSGNDILDRTYFEMRWRALSLAADLDRIERGTNGSSTLASDLRIRKLHQAFKVLSESHGSRAEQVQMIFSDLTPPPGK